MANKSKRLQFLERNRRVAAIARREAIGALAEAQASEDQTASLASRSRLLAGTYGRSSQDMIGHDLAHRGVFAASLAGIATDAEKARKEAADQRVRSVNTLAAREQRLDRIDESLAGEKREANRAAELREITDGAVLARKLLRPAAKHDRNRI